MSVDGVADGELGHLQGHQDDALNISDEDFPCKVQRAAGSPFDNVSSCVGGGRFDGNDFVWVCTHSRR